jgi:hypothetical protein
MQSTIANRIHQPFASDYLVKMSTLTTDYHTMRSYGTTGVYSTSLNCFSTLMTRYI